MQTINDNTPGLRKKMSDLGIPDFNVGINSEGNTYHEIGGYRVDHDQARADRAIGSKVDAVINKVRQDYGAAWHAANGGGYKNVTTAFDAQLDRTMAYFSISRDWFNINSPKRGLGKEIDKMMFFRSKVNDNAVFDIKRTSFSRANLGAEYGIYRGQEFRYDDFGNYNYGVAAKYFGLTLDRALLGAGLNQISKFNPDLGNLRGYFDHRRDTEMIIRGYYHKW